MLLPCEAHAPADFDFIIGRWRVAHRRLATRLCGSQDWVAFEGESATTKILGGYGNLEDNLLKFPEGDFRAAALRSFCEADGLWSIWWLDGRNPTCLDTPVRGKFVDHIGLFYADDVLDGQAIKVRFTWFALPGQAPAWEQAFSSDGGLSWETNWQMTFYPVDSAGC